MQQKDKTKKANEINLDEGEAREMALISGMGRGN